MQNLCELAGRAQVLSGQDGASGLFKSMPNRPSELLDGCKKYFSNRSKADASSRCSCALLLIIPKIAARRIGFSSHYRTGLTLFL